jgi:lipopolysaccharide transport system ATP-binding protein
MNKAITINSVSKQYVYIKDAARYDTLRDSVSHILRPKKRKEKFWALKDINLEINEGERLGIIGNNGAGKTTLLKILSRITPPNSGEIVIEGRVASLLEVGTGFHPELSGRENIFLNGAILGLKRSEIIKKIDSIIDFSGIEKFIDTSLKFYSTGMQLRLAFSVAAHLEADILMIDEILAVGDAEFQQKCISKMEELNKSSNKTILFISHDLNAISNLTENCILLDKGVIEKTGKSRDVVNNYLSRFIKEDETRFTKYADQPYFENIALITSAENKIQYFGDNLKILVTLCIPTPLNTIEFSYQVFNESKPEPIVYNWFSSSADLSYMVNKTGIFKITIEIPSLRLYKGNYYFKFYLSDPRSKTVFQTLDHLLPFHIQMVDIQNEWGWQENVCNYIEEYRLNIDHYEPLS